MEVKFLMDGKISRIVNDVHTLGEIEDEIMKEYVAGDIGILDLLNNVVISGMSISDTVKLYAILLKVVDDDDVVRVAEGEFMPLTV